MHSVLAPVPQLDPARRLKKAHTGSKRFTLSSRISIFAQVIGIYLVLRMNMELIIYCRVCRPRHAILKFVYRYLNTNEAVYSPS